MPNPKAARKAAQAQLASPDAVKKCLSGDALHFAIQQIKEHAKTAPKPLSIANQEHRAYTRMAAMQYVVLMFQTEADLSGNKFSIKQIEFLGHQEQHLEFIDAAAAHMSAYDDILVRKLGPYCGWMELICVLVMRRSLQRSAANV